MMTNATAAPDPVAAALAIARDARREADRDNRSPNGIAAVAVLASGIVFSLIAITAMLSSPATIPIWCAAHGGCM